MITHDDGSVTLSFDELQALKGDIEYEHGTTGEYGLVDNTAWLYVSNIMRRANSHVTAVQLGLDPKVWAK